VRYEETRSRSRDINWRRMGENGRNMEDNMMLLVDANTPLSKRIANFSNF